MNETKSKFKQVREKARKRGFKSLAALARHIGCARTSLYLAIERPSRYSRIHNRITQTLDE